MVGGEVGISVGGGDGWAVLGGLVGLGVGRTVGIFVGSSKKQKTLNLKICASISKIKRWFFSTQSFVKNKKMPKKNWLFILSKTGEINSFDHYF